MESTIKDSASLPFFHFLGKRTMNVVNYLGGIVIFFTLAFLKIFRPKQIREIIQQVFYIGARSSNIVVLVGLFTGMVLGLQLYYTLVKFGSEGVLGSVVALTLIRELGPVLTAIMITARAGSAMTPSIPCESTLSGILSVRGSQPRSSAFPC
jgi:phospholipid/cholesterol/gamma-HCH transport system permease protein